jgi:hypothetical protein
VSKSLAFQSIRKPLRPARQSSLGLVKGMGEKPAGTVGGGNCAAPLGKYCLSRSNHLP